LPSGLNLLVSIPGTGTWYIQRYVDLGIDKLKLFLGTPWYGYYYPCLVGTKIDDRYCPIASVEFRGVNCSDAAGSEHDYAQIRNSYQDGRSGKTNHSVSLQKRDDNMNAPWFNEQAEDGGVIGQYWYDDAVTLRFKYSWAKEIGLGGVGPYCLNMLAELEVEEEKIDMWSSLDEFVAKK
jgi:di-N-acetylchitobiase